jgi:putative membrane-bound dehydrogenase-like protein
VPHRSRIRAVRWPILVAAGLVAAFAADAAGPPYSPQESLAHFRLDPGLRIELVASEPDVQSPVAMDIDERGRWFVVEMPGYPLDTRPTGRVRLLEDTDGDGRPDRSRIFADGLVLPNGIMRWKRGVIVTSAPDVLYLEDTDDDGRADRREVLVTGFAVTNPQHMVNTPVYGLDNWIHLAHEGPAGAVIYTTLFGDPGKPLTMPAFPGRAAVDPHRRSVRFRPETGDLETQSGQSQYGHGFDAWGRYFTANNADHLREEVLAARYLARNPYLPSGSGQAPITDHGEAAQVFPITRNPTFELLTESGEFTSACSPTPYTGGLLQGDYPRSVFVDEPVHNLVHRDVLEPSGAAFVARRASEGREFLASTDAWFRPVASYVGPDGALYVIDYYRKRIEHPEWTATEFQKDPSEFSLGQDRGRIYRIVPDGAPTPMPVVSLDRAGPADLVAALSNPTLWWRRTAQRLLVDGHRTDAVPALVTLATRGAAPLGRLHALWTLDGLGRMDDDVVRSALADSEPGVRANALQLAESRLSDATLAAAVLDRAGVEADPQVRFQLLATLGFIPGASAAEAESRLLFDHLDDPWMQLAALSAGPDRAAVYLSRALAPGAGITTSETGGRTHFLTLAATVISARAAPAELDRIFAAISGDSTAAAAWWEAALLDGLAQGLRGSNITPFESFRPALVSLARRDAAAVRRAALAILARTGLPDDAATQAAVVRSAAMASDPAVAPDRRADAITLLGLSGAGAQRDRLEGLVDPRQPEIVQVAAIRALSTIKGEEIGRGLLPRWAELTPGARSALVDLLLETRARQRILVEALSAGRVQSWAMTFWQKSDLLMNDDAGIRASARALLEESPERRAAVVNRYAAAVEQGGDPARGQVVFQRVCSACHHLGGGTASDLGPDLATVRHRPPLALLVDILSPSQSIAQGYEVYAVERLNGRTDAGTLAAQSPEAITLRQAGGTVVIPRREIRTLTMIPQSPMPSELDKMIAPEEMADLIAFITRR